MVESLIAEPKFAIWKLVSGVFPETNMNLFAIPRATQRIVRRDMIKTCRLKNRETERVSIIIAVLKMKVKGVSNIYDRREDIEFLLKTSINILVITETINVTVTGFENIILRNFFINFPFDKKYFLFPILYYILCYISRDF